MASKSRDIEVYGFFFFAEQMQSWATVPPEYPGWLSPNHPPLANWGKTLNSNPNGSSLWENRGNIWESLKKTTEIMLS